MLIVGFFLVISMYRYKVKIEYQGTVFSGWQRQENAFTIQEAIEQALFVMTKEKAEVYGSGRTDAGVHAIAQVAHLDLTKNFTSYQLQQGLNYHLRNHPISIYDVCNLGENSEFHARFSAIERSYIYKILNRGNKPTWEHDLTWWVPQKLDVNVMQKASNLLLGHHDFSTFRAQGCQAKSPMKTINSINFVQDGDIIAMNIKAPSFLYHQVRNIVGSLYKVGLKHWTIDEFHGAFLSCDRTKGGLTAPSCGLYFHEVTYS